MNYPGVNYNTDSIRQNRVPVLPSTYRPRYFPRYVRPGNHRAYRYGISVNVRPRVRLMSRNRPFRPSPQRMYNWSYDSPIPMNSSDTPNYLHTGLPIIGRIIRFVGSILRFVQFIMGKGQEKLGVFGNSPGCTCGAVAATSAVIVVGVGLGVGVAVGIGAAVGVETWFNTGIHANVTTVESIYYNSTSATTYNSTLTTTFNSTLTTTSNMSNTTAVAG